MIHISAAILKKISPRIRNDLRSALPSAMNAWLPRYHINTQFRVVMFLAQAAHETAGFHTLEEYGGTRYFTRLYEGRSDLGNTEKGDGARYHGRGIFQLTGRFNYRKYGERLDIDLENSPEQAAGPGLSVHIACLYWQDKKLNELADRGDIEGVTRKINGGLNGLLDRKEYYRRALELDLVESEQAKAPPKRGP